MNRKQMQQYQQPEFLRDILKRVLVKLKDRRYAMNYDDFDFDGYNGMDDTDDDFSEDTFEEEFEPELDEFEAQEENDEPFAPESENSESAFDFQEAFILGGMIVGQAYEQALDDKEQQKQLDKDKKDED